MSEIYQIFKELSPILLKVLKNKEEGEKKKKKKKKHLLTNCLRPPLPGCQRTTHRKRIVSSTYGTETRCPQGTYEKNKLDAYLSTY